MNANVLLNWIYTSINLVSDFVTFGSLLRTKLVNCSVSWASKSKKLRSPPGTVRFFPSWLMYSLPRSREFEPIFLWFKSPWRFIVYKTGRIIQIGLVQWHVCSEISFTNLTLPNRRFSASWLFLKEKIKSEIKVSVYPLKIFVDLQCRY